MTNFTSAFWVEALKMRRSKVPFFTVLGFSMMPLVDGLFMIILKDPEAARSLGLISAKAQLMAGAADWTAFFGFLTQAVAAGGLILFSIITIWVFGREFSDRTVKELLALPTSRETIVTAKFIVIALWALVITLFIFVLSLIIGTWVEIPGWSFELAHTAFIKVTVVAVLNLPLITFAALLASAGRGYLPPFGWMVFTLVLANIAAVLGWGDWFPWAIPGMFSGVAGPGTDILEIHSYVILILTGLLGLAATYWWWRNADQTR